MNYSIHQTRGQRANERETQGGIGEREVERVWVIQRDRWIDKDKRLLYFISSNNDRDIEKVVKRFLIKERSVPSGEEKNTRKFQIDSEGV